MTRQCVVQKCTNNAAWTLGTDGGPLSHVCAKHVNAYAVGIYNRTREMTVQRPYPPPPERPTPVTTFATPAPEIERDRWGRPLIVPPGGGKPVPYTRATTLAGSLDDTYGLMGWKQRMTALGLVLRPDLLTAVAAHRDNKVKLGKIVDEATEAAAASAAATTGTALHSLTEQIDRGQDIGFIPKDAAADLDAYTKATAPLTHVHIEQMCVLDDLKVAGTPDRIVEHQGELYVADLKTGSINYPHKIAAQLALYAHGMPYDHESKARATWGFGIRGDINTERAIIIHLPAGSGTCELVWIDIARGWEAVSLAVKVRGWRAQRDLVTPFDDDPWAGDSTADNIAAATTVDELTELWRGATVWTEDHTALARARRVLIEAKATSRQPA